MQGVFFLPAGFIGTGRIAWWDRIAYLVRHSSSRRWRSTIRTSVRFPLETADRLKVLRAMVRLYESGDTDRERFLRRPRRGHRRSALRETSACS